MKQQTRSPTFNQGFMFNDFASVDQRLLSAEKVYESMKQKFVDIKTKSKELQCPTPSQ